MKVLQTDPLNAKSPVEIELMIRDAGFASPQEFNHAVNMRTTTFEQGRAARWRWGAMSEQWLMIRIPAALVAAGVSLPMVAVRAEKRTSSLSQGTPTSH